MKKNFKKSSRYEKCKELMYKGFYVLVAIVLICIFLITGLLENEEVCGVLDVQALIATVITLVSTIVFGGIYFIVYIKIFG